jgi:hypothetical protein
MTAAGRIHNNVIIAAALMTMVLMLFQQGGTFAWQRLLLLHIVVVVMLTVCTCRLVLHGRDAESSFVTRSVRKRKQGFLSNTTTIHWTGALCRLCRKEASYTWYHSSTTSINNKRTNKTKDRVLFLRGYVQKVKRGVTSLKFENGISRFAPERSIDM